MSSNLWPPPPVQPWTQPTPDPILTRDELIAQWQLARSNLAVALAAELKLRNALVTSQFPNAEEGANTVDLANGWKLTATIKYNYNLDNKRIDDAIDRMELLGERGKLIAERLVKYKAELSISEYRKLTDENAGDTEAKINAIINDVLTIKPGTPSLELKEPSKKG
jgi:hypothetical protein